MMIGASRVGDVHGEPERPDRDRRARGQLDPDRDQPVEAHLRGERIGTGYRTLFVDRASGRHDRSGRTAACRSSTQNTTIIGPDPGPNAIANRTGNSLIARAPARARSRCRTITTRTPAPPDVNFLADRYEFQFYFLRTNPARNFGNFGYYLDLVQAKSQIVRRLLPAQRRHHEPGAAGPAAAAATPITLAWDPGKAVSAPAFYTHERRRARSPRRCPRASR